MLRLFLGLSALAGLALPARAADDPPALKREFRAAWVATVANIDWPSKPGLPAEQQKAELTAIFDKAAELKLNAVIFQIRPMADALYESKLEPWSVFLTGTPGKSPGYDPLALAIELAHSRGIELHVWFNPYRARVPSAKAELTADHITKARPDLAKPYGTHSWMNPTHPAVQAHSLRVFMDVVDRYDIDGIHIDDYFYPYKEKDADGKVIPFPDDDTWGAYQKAGGELARDDWRRDAVNAFVKKMYEETKKRKPLVKVGISPFGIWRPGHPEGIAGLDQYAELYADAKLWLNEGWIDYFTPQLYWPIAQEKQSFPKLLDWWAGENTHKRHLWPGLYTSRVTGADKGWPAKEVADQLRLTRKQPGSVGAVHFSMKALLKNVGGVADEVKTVYTEPALVPESPWLAKGDLLVAPEVAREVADGKAFVRVRAVPGMRFVVVQTQVGGVWETVVAGLAPDGTARVSVPEKARAVVRVLDRAGRVTGPAEVK